MTPPRAWFVVHPQGLVIRREGDRVELPTSDDAAALGLVDADTHDLAPFEGAQAVAASIGDGPLRAAARGRPAARALPGRSATRDSSWPVEPPRSSSGPRRTSSADDAPRAPSALATERCMRCPACGLLGYPRISPAVIVLVRRGNEALLARGARFPGRVLQHARRVRGDRRVPRGDARARDP